MTRGRDVARQEKKRVLVAEGEPIIRYGLLHLTNLQSDLEVCSEHGNADRILEDIVIQQADLLVIDFFLISPSIFQLLETILAQNPNLRILVLSRYDEFLYAHRVLSLGAKGYLRKDASIDEILGAMRQIVGGGTFVSQRLKEFWVDSLLETPTKVLSSPLNSLSNRELEIFHLMGKGFNTIEIAATLHRSVKTIESHRKHIKQKLKLQTTARLIQQAIQHLTITKVYEAG